VLSGAREEGDLLPGRASAVLCAAGAGLREEVEVKQQRRHAPPAGRAQDEAALAGPLPQAHGQARRGERRHRSGQMEGLFLTSLGTPLVYFPLEGNSKARVRGTCLDRISVAILMALLQPSAARGSMNPVPGELSSTAASPRVRWIVERTASARPGREGVRAQQS